MNSQIVDSVESVSRERDVIRVASRIVKDRACPRTTIKDIADAACDELGASRDALLGRQRHGSIVAVRRVIAYLAHTYAGAGLAQIGRQLNRDHTTILYHVRAANEQIGVDSRFAKKVQLVKWRLGL